MEHRMSEESPHARSARLLRRSGATLSATKAHTMPPRAQKPPPLKKPLHIFLTAEQFRYAALLSHQIPFISWSIPQLRELRGLQLPTAVMALSKMPNPYRPQVIRQCTRFASSVRVDFSTPTLKNPKILEGNVLRRSSTRSHLCLCGASEERSSR